MARYVVHVRSPKSQEEAFAYMADLTNFAEWDPGVISATQIDGETPTRGSAFDVEVKGFPRPIVLRYHLTTFESPNRFVAEATSKMLTSVDVITVRPAEGGSIVTYDAELTLNGLLALANPLVGLVFTGIGDRAAAGLVRVLDGHKTEAPA